MDDTIRIKAAQWHIRLAEGGDADWEAFAEWVAESSEHARAYAEVEDVDTAIAPLLPDLVFRHAANDEDAGDVAAQGRPATVTPRGRWLLAGGALAATIAATVMLWPASSRYAVVTAPGEHQIVSLDADTRITLNGSTHMVFDRKDARYAQLESGEALFDVHHDARRTFRLIVGEDTVEDAGTVFNVVHDAGGVRVAVSEGRVFYKRGRDTVPLDAGRAIDIPAGNTSITVEEVAPAAVGGWQRGQLMYRGEPLSRVALDLSRAWGCKVVVAGTIAARSFHGTIALEDGDALHPERLAPALSVTFRRNPEGWVMEPAGADAR